MRRVEVGRGTRANVYLPRQGGDDQSQEVDAAKTDKAHADAGQTVVVVDDEDDVRELVCTTLRDVGYRVHEASDGLQATDLLQAIKRIDLLVTDIVCRAA